MDLREFLQKTIKTTINGMISEGKPIPMDTPNDFVYSDFKKYAYKNRTMFKKELQKSKGDSSKMFLTLSALWYKWARKNHKEFTHIKDSKKFGRALMVMMVKDDLIFSIDAFKKTNNIAKLKEDEYVDQAFNDAKPVEEETKRDYKKEYAKYGKSKKAKKYRAELNKYNRDKGTYGNGDGKDASHKGGKIVGFEDESKNRGRAEKSRLKKEGVMSDLHLLINKSKSEEEFVKTFFKNYGKQVKKTPDSVEWAKELYLDMKNESINEARSKKVTKQMWAKMDDDKKIDALLSVVKDPDDAEKYFDKKWNELPSGFERDMVIYELVNEAKYYITRNLGRGQGKSLVGGYDLKRDKKLPPKVFKSYKDAQKEVDKLQRGGSMGGQMTAYIITDKDMNPLTEGKKKLPKFKNIPSWARYVAQASDGEWTWYEDTPTMIKFKNGGGAWKQDGNQTYTGVKTNGKDWDKIPTYYNVKNNKITESSEQIDEKLITFSGRAPYGQAVFMAGGAGSGKGFAIDNFVDAAGFKVRDVDEMKKAIAKLDQLEKFSVDKWFSKYGKKLSNKPNKNGGLSPKAHIEEFMLGKGLSISDIANPKHKLGGLKNPNNVASLHYIVDSMGLKDKWVINMLSGKKNKETLPNLLFDITAKKVASITDVIKPLEEAGYDSKNIHLIWVLSDYYIAVDRNKTRDRVVPDDILLQTHEGAGKTMWTILTKALPKGLNGRIDVILNNSENTIYHIQPSVRKSDDDGDKIGNSPTLKGEPKKVGVVSGFLSLPIKKQGGGIASEKDWKLQLFKWIGKNAPNTLDLSQNVVESVNEANDTYFKTAGEAVDFAKTKAEKKGYEIDEDDWNNQITHGGRYSRLRPSVGKTHTFQIGLLKKGKPQRKGLSISLFGMDSGNYELTYYIN
jgi:hypothetical protein